MRARNLGKTLAKTCTELQPSIFIFFDRGYNFHRNMYELVWGEPGTFV